jgi:hypothetical protein
MSKFTANGLVCFSPRSTFTRRANTDWQGSNKLLASGNNEAEHSMLGSLLFVSCHIQQFHSIPLPALAFLLYLFIVFAPSQQERWGLRVFETGCPPTSSSNPLLTSPFSIGALFWFPQVA